MAKGIVLFSGGLDSLLTVKLLQQQNVELIGLLFILPFNSPFADPQSFPAVQAANRLGLDLRFHYCGRDYLDMVKNPLYGYGKGMNPCIDCKIYFMRKAAEQMKQEGADFVASGEVVGQRPMSQMKNTLRLIEKQSGLDGRLLRPLSAKILEPTIPEKEGLLDRDKFLDLNGRSRKRQMQLAEEFELYEYQSPGGGCLFTDRFIAGRVKHLLETCEEYSAYHVYLLTLGRHFSLSGNRSLIVSRNEKENTEFEKFAEVADYIFLPEFKGPVALGRGDFSAGDLVLAGRIIARYGRPDEECRKIKILHRGNEIEPVEAESAMDDVTLEQMRI